MPEFYVYKCSANNGLETWVKTHKDTSEYDKRDCETLDRIAYWPEPYHEEL